jgi:ABC-type branched-subunit amino acid transport system ATPase component
VSSGYGAIEALKSIDMRIDKGEIVTLIGANGAGKSTTLRSITGLVPPTSGEVIFEGRTLNGMPTHQITALGISMVPEGRAISRTLRCWRIWKWGHTCRGTGRRTLLHWSACSRCFPD